MSDYIISQNVSSYITPTYYIPGKEGINYVNIESLKINNLMNVVDYKSNYFAFIRKDLVSPNKQALGLCYSNNTDQTYNYILQIIRVPVKKYNSKQDLINEVNKSYSYSILNALEKNYIKPSVLIGGPYVFNVFVLLKEQTVYINENKYPLYLEEDNTIDYDNKMLKRNSPLYCNLTHDNGIYTLNLFERYQWIDLVLIDNKTQTKKFGIYYDADKLSVFLTDDDSVRSRLKAFFDNYNVYLFVSDYIIDDKKYSFYFYSRPVKQTITTNIIEVRPYREGDESKEIIKDDTTTVITVSGGYTMIDTIITKVNTDSNEIQFINSEETKTYYRDDSLISVYMKTETIGYVMNVTIDSITGFIAVFPIEEYRKLYYSNTYKGLENYTFYNDKNIINTVKTVNFIRETINSNIKIINNYDETNNTITYDMNLLPVDIIYSTITKIESLTNLSEKNYNTEIINSQAYYDNNKLKLLTNNYLQTSNIYKESLYSSFNCNPFNILHYLSTPVAKIEPTTNNLLSVNNKMIPVIYGNMMTSYIYNDNKIFIYDKNDFELLENVVFKKTYEVINALNTQYQEIIRIAYSYTENIDNYLNNNRIDQIPLFNVLKTLKYDVNKSEVLIEVNKNVKLPRTGVYVYIMGTGYFQWPLLNTKGTIKYNYIT